MQRSEGMHEQRSQQRPAQGCRRSADVVQQTPWSKPGGTASHDAQATCLPTLGHTMHIKR